MNAIRRTWPAALVLLSMAALALSIQSSAEAKKKPEPAVWAVTIPACAPAGANLCGIQQLHYQDGSGEDGLAVSVTGGEEYSRFSFTIYRCLPGEQCYDEDPPLPVFLQDIQLVEIPPINFEESPCRFPGIDGDGDTLCRELAPPLCMECFLNGTHPHWADATGEAYRSFSFELTVFDYDYAETALPYNGVGYLSIELYNSGETLVPPGTADDHNIFADNWEVPTVVEITTGPVAHSWAIDVTATQPMLFREWYEGCARDPNPKGKCPTEAKFPLDATSTNAELAFQVTWTRLPSEG